MEFLQENRIFKFRPDQLKSVRKQYNFDKAGDMSRAIDILEEWIKQQKHFVKKDLPRNYLEKAIIGSKGSIERAKGKLDKICTYRTMIPDFFGDNLTKNSFDNIEEATCVIFPQPTDENYRVCLLKLTGKSYSYSKILNCYRYLTAICEYLMAYDYSDGIILLVDYLETDLVEMIKYLNLTHMRQIFAITIEGYGMRVKGIHLMTTSKAIDTLVTIVRQFLSPKLGKRIVVHKEISTFLQYVPQGLLSVDYGGEQKSLKELRANLMAEIKGAVFRKYLEEMNEAKTDQSQRQSDVFDEQYSGMAGSFRTLSVD